MAAGVRARVKVQALGGMGSKLRGRGDVQGLAAAVETQLPPVRHGRQVLTIAMFAQPAASAPPLTQAPRERRKLCGHLDLGEVIRASLLHELALRGCHLALLCTCSQLAGLFDLNNVTQRVQACMGMNSAAPKGWGSSALEGGGAGMLSRLGMWGAPTYQELFALAKAIHLRTTQEEVNYFRLAAEREL